MPIPSPSSLLVALLLAVVFMGLLFFAFKFFKGSTSSRYIKKKILTPNEAEFFRRIRKAVPDLYIFPQVGMAALIEPGAKKEGKWWEDFRHISQKRVDYAIFSEQMELIVIIELDDKMHIKENDVIRDSYTSSAGIRTLRFESRSKPTVTQIRTAIAACT